MSIGVFMTAENSSHEQQSMDLGDGFWVSTFGKFFCPQRAIESGHLCVFWMLGNQFPCKIKLPVILFSWNLLCGSLAFNPGILI